MRASISRHGVKIPVPTPPPPRQRPRKFSMFSGFSSKKDPEIPNRISKQGGPGIITPQELSPNRTGILGPSQRTSQPPNPQKHNTDSTCTAPDRGRFSPKALPNSGSSLRVSRWREHIELHEAAWRHAGVVCTCFLVSCCIEVLMGLQAFCNGPSVCLPISLHVVPSPYFTTDVFGLTRRLYCHAFALRDMSPSHWPAKRA